MANNQSNAGSFAISGSGLAAANVNYDFMEEASNASAFSFSITSALQKLNQAQSKLYVLVRDFNFSEISPFSTSNREFSYADLQQAAAVIAEYHRKAGFMFAYVYLPKQTLKHGQVELAILEGQLYDKHFEK